MRKQKNKRLYRSCTSRSISIRHACEVGVYMPHTSNIIDFIADGTRSTLVEPDPRSLTAIQELFSGRENITVHPFAIFDYNGTLELIQRNASTYVGSLPSSPAIVNDKYAVKAQDRFSVECRTFDTVDDGTIDLLSIDVEGSEWYVIKNLRSRPKVISVETHGKRYINPFIQEINGWMKANGYRVWYKDSTDTVFSRNDVIEMKIEDRLALPVRNLTIVISKYKRVVKDSLRRRPRLARDDIG